jgi:hypothetical protein
MRGTDDSDVVNFGSIRLSFDAGLACLPGEREMKCGTSILRHHVHVAVRIYRQAGTYRLA